MGREKKLCKVFDNEEHRELTKPFEGQLARKCGKDYVLHWITGQRITPKAIKVALLFEHRKTIIDFEEMLQKL